MVLFLYRFFPFSKIDFEKRIFYQNMLKIAKKRKIKIKIATIAYSMKGCFSFSTFLFWISPNLAKYTYTPSPPEQHHKCFFGTLH